MPFKKEAHAQAPIISEKYEVLDDLASQERRLTMRPKRYGFPEASRSIATAGTLAMLLVLTGCGSQPVPSGPSVGQTVGRLLISGNPPDNPTAHENQNQASFAIAAWRNDPPAVWYLVNPVTKDDIVNGHTPILEGFASATSVNKGEGISFYVSTTMPTYTLQIFRMGYYNGIGGAPIYGMRWTGLPGSNQYVDHPCATSEGCTNFPCGPSITCDDWQPTALPGIGTTFYIPTDWVSGVYVAKLTDEWTGKQSYIIFVVRDDARASTFLMTLDVNTYQAYNSWGALDGGSYYSSDPDAPGTNPIVSFNRPYLPFQFDHGSFGSGAGSFFAGIDGGNYHGSGWEYNMVRFLEANGYDVTYATNVDLHARSNLLANHKVFISAGHDEYWSLPERAHLENARDTGTTSMAFFSGNTVWNLVKFDPDSRGNPNRIMTRLTNFSGNAPFVASGNVAFIAPLAPSQGVVSQMYWPETSVVGGTWGVGLAGSSAPGVDATLASNPPAWLTANTSLSAGSLVGNKLGGYETQGQNGRGPTSNVYPYPGPSSMQVLFSGASGAWQGIWYTAPSGSEVVSTGSVQWSWGLDDFCMEGWAPVVYPPFIVPYPQYISYPDDPGVWGSSTCPGSPVRFPRSDANVQQMTANILGELANAHNYANGYGDGTLRPDTGDTVGKCPGDYGSDTFRIQSVSAAPEYLIVSNNGQANQPIIVYGDQCWQYVTFPVTPTCSNTCTYTGPMKQCPLDSLPGAIPNICEACAGRYGNNAQSWWKAVSYYVNPPTSVAPAGPYTDCGWFQLLSAANGQNLMIGNNGALNGPVQLIDLSSDPQLRQQGLWRFWRYRNTNAYVLQNGNGQLLIVGANGMKDGPVIAIGSDGTWGEEIDNTQKLWSIVPVLTNQSTGYLQ